MRRLFRSLVVPILLFASLGVPVPAAGQTDEAAAPVGLRLRAQTPWNGPDLPLKMAVEATNHSTAPLEALSLVLFIQAPARSRSVYALSLQADATVDIDADRFSFDGSLQPGETRVFRLKHTLEVAVDLGETAIYPLRLDLFSGDALVGTLRTPLIFLAEKPEVQLGLAWTWVLTAPIEYGPDGVFLPGSLESDVAPGGRLDSMAAALARLAERNSPVNVAVSPVLVDQLARMSSGYRIVGADGVSRSVDRRTGRAADAARILDLLSSIARDPATEFVSVPFGDPHLPALVSSGLVRDLRTLMQGGSAMLQSGLGVEPTREIAWPPSSALDAASAVRLRRQGTRTVILGPQVIPPVEGEPFSVPPVVRLGSGQRAMAAVVADEEVARLVDTFRTDPRLAAQAALGKLAATWLEFPGTAGRAAAVVLSGDPSIPPFFYGSLASRVLDSPWLAPVRVSTLVTRQTERAVRPLPEAPHPVFHPFYVERLLRARASVAQFAEAADGVDSLVEQLEEQLFVAEAGTFVERPDLGLRFIQWVEQTVRKTYDGVRVIQTEVPITLASREGALPITLSNESGLTLRVRVRLLADRRIAFVKGSSRVVTLPPENHTLTFPVRAETTGRFPVHVEILTPVDPAVADTITESDLLVRSTAYNRVALFLTIGAAVFLVGWWGRRFVPRRRS